MSIPRLIKMKSTQQISQQNKQTCITKADYGSSSIDTFISNTKTSEMQSYYPLLVEQIKKLSKDNDRLWNLLTENEDQHLQCGKVQKKLKSNLDCAEKQLNLIKEMYIVEKSNFDQSKLFYQKRQTEWQQIVNDLKMVIQDYQSCNKLDLNKASKIFQHSSKINSQQYAINPQQCAKRKFFQEQLSIYSKRQQYERKNTRQQRSSSKDIRKQKRITHRRAIAYKQTHQQTSNQSQISYQVENPRLPQTLVILTMQDIFQRVLRKTYLKYRNENIKSQEIIRMENMEKLRIAKSSTKERLNKTVKKIFITQSLKEHQDIVKFIEDKIYKRHKILRGDLAFSFLAEKFKQCQQIFQSSNSALSSFNSEPTDTIQRVNLNSRFKNFEQKRKQLRSQEGRSMKDTAKSPINALLTLDSRRLLQVQSLSNLTLNLDSNIKSSPIKNIGYNPRINCPQQIDYKNQYQKSLKNIYTQKGPRQRKYQKDFNDSNQDLSSLIASQEYQVTSKQRKVYEYVSNKQKKYEKC